ncbi:MAG: NAD(P)/FAD-dependent oxidoreductase [Clostridia bacterium]|nr:NAD(P)/FAD-dependent oxidoreductase [Clostridia bacterium]
MANILIIGGGVSGLSAGIFAQLSGHHATVCEKHAVAGGNLTGWQRGEYHIDNCIHWLTGTNPAADGYKIWKALGALDSVKIYQGDSLYTCEYEGVQLSLHKDLQRIRQEMLSLSPEDGKEIDAFIIAVELMERLCGVGGKEHNEGLSAREKLLKMPSLLRYYSMTTGELAARFTHPALRFFISSLLGNDFGALALVMIFSTFCGENGGIPEGGSLEMAKRISARFTALGGTLLTSKEAVRIYHAGGRAYSARFADGSVIEADYIVLTADPESTFKKILQLPMPKQLKRLYENPRLKRFSSYQCAIACDLPTPPFRGDFAFKIPESYRKVLGTDCAVIREFSHESSFAPKGKTILQTLTFCYEDEAKCFIELRERDPMAYKAKKEELARTFIKLLSEKLPQLEGKLTCIDVWTPATYRRYTNAETGSFMSFALPSKALPKRVSNRIPGLSNVILATQWQQCPGGLPIAAEGGRLAIEAINKAEEKALAATSKGHRKSAPAYSKI